MSSTQSHVGSPVSRVDGRLKVTGRAPYSAEFPAADLAYGCVLSATIAKGTITALDIAAARAVPGVLQIYTHENRPRTAWLSSSYHDEVAPPGKPFRPLYDAHIIYNGQPIALVVAENIDVARYAASLIGVEYAVQAHHTDLQLAQADAYVPPKKRSGIAPPPGPKGNAMQAYAEAPVRVWGEYKIAREFHNPIELHATIVIPHDDGSLMIHDKTQGAQNTQGYVASVFGLAKDKVRVVSPYVGGAFGSALRPQYQLFLAVMAALDLKRPVQVEMTREQMFTHVHRPETINIVGLAASKDGALRALKHEAVQGTSTFEDYQEVVVNWSGLLYHADNLDFDYKLAKLDTYTPGDMRAPGAPLGTFAIESAMDELAYATGLNPLEVRLRNYTETDELDSKPFTSKELRACFESGAKRFGWPTGPMIARSMRDGPELIGWGMAAGAWEATMQQTTARARLLADGRLEIATATADIGTGTYTILTQIAADTLGLPLDAVITRLGDSALPTSPVEGGSWTAASAGSAVLLACRSVRQKLFEMARGLADSPLANTTLERILFENGQLVFAGEPSRAMTIGQIMRAAGVHEIEAEETSERNPDTSNASSYTHSAVFAEVRIDEELGQIRVTRIVNAVAAGKIINPKTARSQVLGGVVWGMGMALHEEGLTDHRFGRHMNHNLAEYHVPVNADVYEIDVIFVDEQDDANPLGVKGLGEIGIVATPAAIANAIHHATGKRIRSLPITVDKILGEPSA